MKMEQIIKYVKEDPELFDFDYFKYAAQQNDSNDIKVKAAYVKGSVLQTIKYLFDQLTRISGDQAEDQDDDKFEIFSQLVVDGMDSESIWQQIEQGRNFYAKELISIIEMDENEDLDVEQSANEDLNIDSDGNDDILNKTEVEIDYGESSEEYQDDQSCKDDSMTSDVDNVDEDLDESEIEQNIEESDIDKFDQAENDVDEDINNDNLLDEDEQGDLSDDKADQLMYADFFDPPKDHNKGQPFDKLYKNFDKYYNEEKDILDIQSESSQADQQEAKDLFSDGEDVATDQDNEEQLTSFQKQQMKLKKTIDTLEEQLVSEKPWTMIGEASGKARPENSLLEHQLDFEHGSKPVPIITDEVTNTLEGLIKQRIKDKAFDDVERKKELPPSLQKPKSSGKDRLEIEENKNTSSLADIYEKEYLSSKEAQNMSQSELAAIAANELKEPKKEHLEIQALFDELNYTLNSLTHYHFVPRPPDFELKVLSTSTPALDMEEVIPDVVSNEAVLAPQEIFAPQVISDDKKKKKRKQSNSHKNQNLLSQKKIQT